MRDHHLCVDCLEAYQARQGGRPRPATMVHHIIPVEERPDLGYDLNNLVALCDTCHNRRHPEKGAGTEKPGPPAGMRIIKL
ncbi:MAG: HNH endonuclease [Clostridia bacterium]